MTLKSFVIATILAHTLLVGYGHTQLYGKVLFKMFHSIH